MHTVVPVLQLFQPPTITTLRFRSPPTINKLCPQLPLVQLRKGFNEQDWKDIFQMNNLQTVKVLLVTFIGAVNASNTLNPVAIGLRSALTSRSNAFGGKTRSRRTYSAPSPAIDFDSLDTYSDFVNGDEDIAISTRSRRGIQNNLIENVSSTKSPIEVKKRKKPRGGVEPLPALTFHENMICGAVSRSIAQVCTHPANV